MTPVLTRAHEMLSQRVVVPMYRRYLGVRPGTRALQHAYAEGTRMRRASASWSDDQRRDWTLRQLRSVVRYAAATAPFYAQRLRDAGFDPRADFDFDDFATLPPLDREDVRGGGQSLVSKALPKAALRRDATGGSSGVPTEIWLGPEERGWRESGINHFMRRIGLAPGSRTAFLWVHHLDPTARDSTKQRAEDWAFSQRWFDCIRLSPELLARYHREMNEWRPSCIVAYAGVAALLAEAAERSGVAPRYPRVGFVTGAEKLRAEERALIERVYDRPVHERYGARDVGPIGFQIAPRSSSEFDIDWMNLLVEPESASPDAAVLVTKLHADGMPMIRYRIGDVARFAPGSAPGHPTFHISEVLGRDTDRLWLPDGRSIHGVGMPHLMKDFPVAEFQVYQSRDYSIQLRVVPRGELSSDQARAIVGVLEANLPGLPVTLERVTTIPRTASNKRRPVVSEIQQSQQRGEA